MFLYSWRLVGGDFIRLSATKSFAETLTASSTKFPVDNKLVITDHVVVSNPSITISGVLDNYSLLNFDRVMRGIVGRSMEGFEIPVVKFKSDYTIDKAATKTDATVPETLSVEYIRAALKRTIQNGLPVFLIETMYQGVGKTAVDTGKELGYECIIQSLSLSQGSNSNGSIEVNMTLEPIVRAYVRTERGTVEPLPYQPKDAGTGAVEGGDSSKGDGKEAKVDASGDAKKAAEIKAQGAEQSSPSFTQTATDKLNRQVDNFIGAGRDDTAQTVAKLMDQKKAAIAEATANGRSNAVPQIKAYYDDRIAEAR